LSDSNITPSLPLQTSPDSDSLYHDKLLLSVGAGTGPGLELVEVAVVNVEALVYPISSDSPSGLTVGGSVETGALGERKGLLSKTGVASPELHLNTVGRVRASVKTVVGASELHKTVAHEVKSLRSGARVAGLHVDKGTVTGCTVLNGST
jgi:hypothetical protein